MKTLCLLLLTMFASFAVGCGETSSTVTPPTGQEANDENARAALEALDNVMRLDWLDLVEVLESGDETSLVEAKRKFAKDDGHLYLIDHLVEMTGKEQLFAAQFLGEMVVDIEVADKRDAALAFLDCCQQMESESERILVSQLAISTLTSAINADPRDAGSLFFRGDELLLNGKVEEALADANSAIDLKPEFVNAIYLRGRALQAKKDHLGAIDNFDRALELESDYADIMVARAFSYNALQRFDEAIEDLTKSLDLKPTWSHAFQLRATAYEAIGEKDKALQDVESAERLRSGQ